MKSNELSDKLINRALNWIDQKWVKNDKECEVCGQNDWSFCPDLLSVLTNQPIFSSNPIARYPFFAIACKECGKTKFFNAHALNLIEDEIKEDEAAQKH